MRRSSSFDFVIVRLLFGSFQIIENSLNILKNLFKCKENPLIASSNCFFRMSNLVNVIGSINTFNQIVFFEEFNNRSCWIIVSHNTEKNKPNENRSIGMENAVPFLETVFVIIGTSTSFATFQTSSNASLNTKPKHWSNQTNETTDLFVAIKEEHTLNINFSIHGLFPSVNVIFITRKSIDEKILFASFLHCLNEMKGFQ